MSTSNVVWRHCPHHHVDRGYGEGNSVIEMPTNQCANRERQDMGQGHKIKGVMNSFVNSLN